MFFAFLLQAAALAQDTVAVPLDATTLQATSACPDVGAGDVPGIVRTNVGVMFGREDGTFSFGCSSRWGGDDGAQVVTDPLRDVMLFLGEGGLYRSVDGGCTALPLEIPEGWTGKQVLYWRDDFYLVAGRTTGTGGTLLLLKDDGWVELATWTDFTPDGAVTSGADVLWIAGARPTVGVRRFTFAGGLTGNEPLIGLPEDALGITAIEPRAADEDEAWFVLKRSTSQWTWHVSWIDIGGGPAPLWASLEPVGRFVAGPAKLGNRWISVIDGKLQLAEQLDSRWTSTTTSVPWTCLHNVGDKLYACAVDELVLVAGVGKEGGAPTSAPVFSFLQVAPPDATCADAACDADWVRVGAALGTVDAAETAVCPDGRTQSDLEATECTCDQGGRGVGAGVLALLLGLRRRRHSPRPRTT